MYKYKIYLYKMKIMLIGDKSVGKTLLIRHLLRCSYTIPTIGFEVVHTPHLEIYDTSGDTKYQKYISRFYPLIKHFVLVYKDLKTVYKYEHLQKYAAEWTLVHNSEQIDGGKEYALTHNMNFIRSNLTFTPNAKDTLNRVQAHKGWRYCWFY